MKRRIWKTLVSALLITVLLIGAIPVSAASVSTNYNNLVYYINQNGEKDEDGNIVLRLVELQNGFIDYSAPNRICLNETEKKRYELVDNDFLFARAKRQKIKK